ncbi:hypothetical protein AA11826_2248 [Komagataeibacter oboediens DSM 11826]|uniref:Uncharacterized protein n=1 Tax=Komagataeibacter oboediens TaxID=65958 RepID=A0A318QJ14_9PROT|nr:hypothetical protein [Komagataeibacter oboediens]PYD79035.1 hypothetical protein CFR80_15675 [Komagataeibacter oboediens]GBQ07627.1 hypothetical protein AA11826_2248 [Komagataeibacter oboediens DSM 11826]
MADIVSIARAIVEKMAAIVYPNGKGAPSVTGRPTKIFRGWLTQADYAGADCTLNRGVDFITVMDLQGGWRRIDEPLGRPWRQDGSPIPATVSVVTSYSGVPIRSTETGQERITQSGLDRGVILSDQSAIIALEEGQTPSGIVGLRIRSGGSVIPDRAIAAYAVQATDTADTIAQALATQIPNASAAGSVITVPDAVTLEAAVGGYSPAVRTARRQQQLFQVTVWSASTKARDAMGTAIENGMAFIDWLTDANGSTFQIEARGDWNNDAAQNSGIFMRPFRFVCTYDTDARENMAQMLFGTEVFSLPGGQTIHTGDGLLLAVS